MSYALSKTGVAFGTPYEKIESGYINQSSIILSNEDVPLRKYGVCLRICLKDGTFGGGKAWGVVNPGVFR